MTDILAGSVTFVILIVLGLIYVKLGEVVRFLDAIGEMLGEYLDKTRKES